MRILKTVAALGLAFPLAAYAGLANTKHNLANSSSNTTKASNATVTNACQFCHTPHAAQATKALWNHKAPGQQGGAPPTYGWSDATTTSGGTSLVGLALTNPGTQRCLGCHDGSTAVGDTINNGLIAMTGNVSAGGYLTTHNIGVYNAGNVDMAKNHPVGIPYAGQTGGIQNTNVLWAYNPATGTSCQTSSGVCVNEALNGNKIPLYGTLGTASIECGSCHEPHTENPSFLRILNTNGQLCTTCHTK